MEILFIVILVVIAIELYFILNKLFAINWSLNAIYEGLFLKDKDTTIGKGAVYFELLDMQVSALKEIQDKLEGLRK